MFMPSDRYTVAGADGSVAFLKVLEAVERQLCSLAAIAFAQHLLSQATALRPCCAPNQIVPLVHCTLHGGSKARLRAVLAFLARTVVSNIVAMLPSRILVDATQ
jgi:hypothetical protein